MKKIYSIIAVSVFLLFLPSVVLAVSAAKEVKEGNRLYKQEKYDDALAQYSSAQTELPDSAIINFNIGSAMYKKGDFQNAIDAFTKSLLTEDKELEAQANYNIANSKYSLGNLKINTDLSGAVSLYREALDYYKRAVELNQDDTEAKYNHELVEKKLKVLLDRLKNQPEQEKDKQKQSQDQQDQQSTPESGAEQQKEEESGTEKQDKEKQDGSQAQQDQQSNPESGAEQQKEEQTGTEQQDEKGAEQQENAEKGEGQAVGQSPDEEAKEMSPEEARMLLDAYGDEEATQMKQGSQGYNDTVLKDW